MSEANGNGPTVVVVAPGEGEAAQDGRSGTLEGGGEIQAEAVEEVAETAVDGAVEIARIEANRDVAIAEIQADSLETAVEASADAAAQSELEECRSRIASLEASNIAQATELETLRAQLILPASENSPANPPPPLEEGEGVAPPEAATAPEPEKPKRKHHKWI